jgi:hypothetical protein
MEEVVITKRVLEMKKRKDADGGDVFELSRKEFGSVGAMNTDRCTGGVYSSWERVLKEIEDLNLPSRLLNGAKARLDAVGFATINIV